ncbi:hypothetical protein CYPRO_0661 [Cyclonatronum proteinivorum]|uniref:Uncharacterized protein n=1 Tax=Cyclonatronum proteinivorum TaxID=1457365 RepID=A0A345UHJ3_9BACT|nr:hypothetical protein [Cyclonatronum proteinivorum]AXI99944.1 hypothetical protein CYPRO_0661 [Cyclonatronum proteinivorum]
MIYINNIHAKLIFICWVIVFVVSSCGPTEKVHRIDLEDTFQDEISRDTNDDVETAENLPDVFFIGGIVSEPVVVNGDTTFVPLPDVTIEIRDESRFLFARANTGLRGQFYVEHRNIQPGREYFIMLVTRDRRATDLINYNFELHSDMSIIVAENFISFRGSDWDDRAILRGSTVPPRTEQ